MSTRPRIPSPVIAAVVTVLVAVLSACSSGGGDGTGPGIGDRAQEPTTSSTAPEGTGGDPAGSTSPTPSGSSESSGRAASLRRFDPPMRFAGDGGVALDSGALEGNLAGDITARYVTVKDRLAYVSRPDGVVAYDVTTGREDWKVSIGDTRQSSNEGPFVGEQGPRPPRIGDDGKTGAAAFVTTQKGSGTTTSRTRLEVVGFDLKTGKERWHIKSLLSKDLDLMSFEAVTDVVGFTDTTVLVTYEANGDNYGALLDTDSGKVIWDTPVSFAGDGMYVRTWHDETFTVSTSEPAKNADGLDTTVPVLTGYSTTDGKQRWQYKGGAANWEKFTAVLPIGPDLVGVAHHLATSDPTGEDTNRLEVLDASTGKERSRTDKLPTIGFNDDVDLGCRYDQRSTTVCAGSVSEVVMAFDAKTGELLWSLPDEQAGREAPKVLTVFHGALYGSTSNGPVILDARTGKDEVTDPGQTAVEVTPYGCIAFSDGNVEFFRATK